MQLMGNVLSFNDGFNSDDGEGDNLPDDEIIFCQQQTLPWQNTDIPEKQQQRGDYMENHRQDALENENIKQSADTLTNQSHNIDTQENILQNASTVENQQQNADIPINHQQNADTFITAQQNADTLMKTQQNADTLINKQLNAEASINTTQNVDTSENKEQNHRTNTNTQEKHITETPHARESDFGTNTKSWKRQRKKYTRVLEPDGEEEHHDATRNLKKNENRQLHTQQEFKQDQQNKENQQEHPEQRGKEHKQQKEETWQEQQPEVKKDHSGQENLQQKVKEHEQQQQEWDEPQQQQREDQQSQSKLHHQHEDHQSQSKQQQQQHECKQTQCKHQHQKEHIQQELNNKDKQQTPQSEVWLHQQNTKSHPPQQNTQSDPLQQNIQSNTPQQNTQSCPPQQNTRSDPPQQKTQPGPPQQYRGGPNQQGSGRGLDDSDVTCIYSRTTHKDGFNSDDGEGDNLPDDEIIFCQQQTLPWQNTDIPEKQQQRGDYMENHRQDALENENIKQSADTLTNQSHNIDTQENILQNASTVENQQQNADIPINHQQNADTFITAQQNADTLMKTQQNADTLINKQLNAEASINTTQNVDTSENKEQNHRTNTNTQEKHITETPHARESDFGTNTKSWKRQRKKYTRVLEPDGEEEHHDATRNLKKNENRQLHTQQEFKQDQQNKENQQEHPEQRGKEHKQQKEETWQEQQPEVKKDHSGQENLQQKVKEHEQQQQEWDEPQQQQREDQQSQSKLHHQHEDHQSQSKQQQQQHECKQTQCKHQHQKEHIQQELNNKDKQQTPQSEVWLHQQNTKSHPPQQNTQSDPLQQNIQSNTPQQNTQSCPPQQNTRSDPPQQKTQPGPPQQYRGGPNQQGSGRGLDDSDVTCIYSRTTHKKSANISKLIDDGNAAIDSKDFAGANQLALQAMVGASEMMDWFLKGDAVGVEAQQLGDWFGSCAFLLNKTGSHFSATRCFYTATVFDSNWTIEEHRNVSDRLWDAILNARDLHLNCEKVFETLDKAFAMAKLALKRGMYKLCSLTCNELDRVNRCLFGRYHLRRPGFRYGSQLQAYHAELKPIALCNAECQQKMGNFRTVKTICAAVLKEMCDYDCPEAFELWGMALLKENEYEVAEMKIQRALEHAKDVDYKDRLQKLLQEIRERLESIKLNKDKYDPEWLGGTSAIDIERMQQSPTLKVTDSSEKPVKSKSKRYHKYDRYKELKQSPYNVPDDVNANDMCAHSTGTYVPNIHDRNVSQIGRNIGKKTSNKKIKITKEYRSGFVLPDSGDDEMQEPTISIEPPPAPEADDSFEEESFYEQSRRMYTDTESCKMPSTRTEELLVKGVKLNLSYLSQFEDKHDSHYKQEPFYEEYESEKILRQYLKIPQTYLRCELEIESAHLAYCKPLDACQIETIEISGRSKTGHAFSGDEVVVKLLGKTHEENNKRYGKVVGVLKGKHYADLKHPVFMCTIDDMATHLMRPICKTVPKLSVLNHEIWKTCPRLKRFKVEIYNYDEHAETLCDPEIVDVNPGQMQKYVFLVAYITWSRRKIYPRGAVIKMLPFGESLTTGLQLLNLRHSVPSLYDRAVISNVENKRFHQFDEIDPSFHTDRCNLRSHEVFTIDPPGSKDLDDALSVDLVDGCYKVGVHIADVSQFVEIGDSIDKEAEMRTTTFYPGIYGKLPRNMLPEPLSNSVCSLIPNKIRLTLTVFFYLSENGSQQRDRSPAVEFKKSYIQSCERFTYREVQDIIEGKEHRLKKKIMWLYNLSNRIRRQRLGDSMMAIDLENEDGITEDSVFETFEAHCLVEEFMIMANRAVAQKLVRSFPECVPLRCQPPPADEKMKQFIDEHGVYIDTSVRLQDKNIFQGKTPKLDSLLGTSGRENTLSVIVPSHVWDKIKSCPSNVSKVVCTDDLYPLQHLVHHHWIAMQKPAEYKCSCSNKNTNPTHHYSLNMHTYTHFTSPIRRYIDLIVHRMLHASLTKNACPYSSNEVKKICQHVNEVTRRAKDYQKSCKILKFAIELKTNPKLVRGIVDDMSDRCISLTSPDMKHIPKNHKELPFNLLDMGFKPELGKDPSTNEDVVTATWKKRLYDFTGNTIHSSERKREKNVNPNQGVVFIPIQQWSRLLKCAVDNRTSDLKRTIENTKPVVKGRGTVNDVSTECSKLILIQPNTTFSLTFSRGQVVNVQFMAAPLKGIMTPRPMLYSMTNNIKLCLQHTDDPVLWLSKYANRATCDQYRDIEMYLERWIPLIHMEAATCAVGNEDSCIINNIHMRFQSAKEGRISLSKAFCEIRNIEFSGAEMDEGDDADECAKAYDWLCLRYISAMSEQTNKTSNVHQSMKTVWVGHANVTNVIKTGKRMNGKVEVTFQLHDLCPSLPPEARHKDNTFCVEILRKSEVDRRTESFIKCMKLPSYQDILAVRIALNRKIYPLDKLHLDMASCIERDMYVLPGQGPFVLPKNNEMQQDAVDKALRNRLTLIQGPPGTGKSFTGIKLMYLFDKINDMIHKELGDQRKQRKQILFCGPSNKSVDLVGRWMMQKLGGLCPKFVRVYGRSIEAIDYPIPGRTFFSKKSTRALKADESLIPFSLHHLIRMKGKPYAEDINDFDRMFKQKEYIVDPETVLDYLTLLNTAAKEEIRQHNVILCTTAVGSNPKVLKASNVYQVIVDEAGMCPEPQCLMPVIATKAEQVVLIGDHKQLRPIIICKQAAELGLQTSLFERYAMCKHSSGVQFTMLDRQYRMNPELCRFPSEQFYEGKLQTVHAKAWAEDKLQNIWPLDGNKRLPHVLISVEGEEKTLTVSTEEGNEHSKSNLQEMELVVKLFRYFIDNGIPGEKINVISQYNAQCAEIRNQLKNEGFKNYNVSTVVSSQGGEWDYVIFSTVRSLPDFKIENNPTIGWCQQNLGFITDQNQINVALTRARKGLIIVGNVKLLKCDKVWKRLIASYERTNCIKTTEEFPPRKTRIQRLKEADKRHWERYGKDRYTPGKATSYEGNFDAEVVDDDDDDEDEDGFTKVRRGKHRMLRTRNK